MLIWVEDAQSQIRAENGVQERIIGYLGSDVEIDTLETLPFDPTMVPKVAAKNLPDDIKWVYFAEIHRLKTGEVLTSQEYKARYGNLAEHGS